MTPSPGLQILINLLTMKSYYSTTPLSNIGTMITAKELAGPFPIPRPPFECRESERSTDVVRSLGPGTDQEGISSFYSRAPRAARRGGDAAGDRARGAPGAASATPARLPDPDVSPDRAPNAGAGRLPGDGLQPRAPWAWGGRSRVSGAGKGPHTSDSGVVPAGVVAAGVVPPGVVPTDIVRISPRRCGPSSPRQPGRGRGRESGERIPPRRSFRVGTWAPPGEGRGGTRTAAGLIRGQDPRRGALNHPVETDLFLLVRMKARREKRQFK